MLIECLEGHYKGRSFELQKTPVTFGRSPDCDFWLDDQTCSRQHARVEQRDGRYFLVDNGSTNGVFVNGRKVEGEAPISKGDRFYLGRHAFLFLSFAADDDGDSAHIDYSLDIDQTATASGVEKTLLTIGAVEPMAAAASQVSQEELDSLRRANRQLQTIYAFSREINGTLELKDLYQLISDKVFDHFEDVERVCIFITDRETGRLDRVVSRAKADTAFLPVSNDVLQLVKRDRAGILASDAMTDNRFEKSTTLLDIRVRSLMCVPLCTRENVLGAVYVENCTKPHCFNEGDLELLTVLGNQMATAIENASLYEELEVSFYETVRSLSKALEAKDKYTRGHSGRVALYAVGIGRVLGLSDARLDNLKVAAELHDIGKIAISEEIINCNRRLTDEEYESIKMHPAHGVEILKPIRFLESVLPIVLHHHERYDGTGYPLGQVGDEIPLEARILNLADAFDAMTTQRPYNSPKTFKEALAQCESESGRSFDRACVEALARYLNERFADRIRGDTTSANEDTALSGTSTFSVEEVHSAIRRVTGGEGSKRSKAEDKTERLAKPPASAGDPPQVEKKEAETVDDTENVEVTSS